MIGNFMYNSTVNNSTVIGRFYTNSENENSFKVVNFVVPSEQHKGNISFNRRAQTEYIPQLILDLREVFVVNMDVPREPVAVLSLKCFTDKLFVFRDGMSHIYGISTVISLDNVEGPIADEDFPIRSYASSGTSLSAMEPSSFSGVASLSFFEEQHENLLFRY